MITLVQYQTADKQLWDTFIDSSKIDSFLFKRDFMEYHANRFVDHSFLVYRKEKIVALLPGNIKGNIFFSHQGLTYGGLIPSKKLSTHDVLSIFNELNKTLKDKGVDEVIYKPTPHIYHKYPSEEDLYALFRLKAIRIACNITSTIFQNNKLKFSELRKRGIRKAKRNDVKVMEITDFLDFWNILTHNLSENHGTTPVHSLSEIVLLSSKFPNKIKLFGAFFKSRLIGGTVIFIMNSIVHVQYIAADIEGKELGALDLIFDKLINEIYIDIPVFDFGQSTEKDGLLLNDGLIFQKEGFGGRGVIYETYKYIL